MSLTDKWTEHFPPMPVKLLDPLNPAILPYNPAVVCTGKHLVVVVRQDRIVHVLDNTKWFSASSQPLHVPPFSCSLSSTVQPETTDVWRRLADVPVEDSTLTTLCGQLKAVGGRNELSESIDTIHLYDRSMDSWHIIGYMPTARCDCLVATLQDDTLVGIGGVTREGTTERRCDVVEVTSHVCSTHSHGL